MRGFFFWEVNRGRDDECRGKGYLKEENRVWLIFRAHQVAKFGASFGLISWNSAWIFIICNIYIHTHILYIYIYIYIHTEVSFVWLQVFVSLLVSKFPASGYKSFEWIFSKHFRLSFVSWSVLSWTAKLKDPLPTNYLIKLSLSFFLFKKNQRFCLI